MTNKRLYIALPVIGFLFAAAIYSMFASGPAVGPSSSAQSGTSDTPATDALSEASAKFNAYVAYMNQTLRASESIDRYRSWVNMQTGPTGRESSIYGLYDVFDSTKERAAATEKLTAAPLLPELDDAMRAYIAANDKLAPVLNEASGYYSRADYKADGMAGGKALHPRIVEAAGPFLKARARLEAVMRVEKHKVDVARLAAIEQVQGRKARWHVANVMMNARLMIDAIPNDATVNVDLAAFNRTLAEFATAVKSMDDYAAKHPDAFFAFQSSPDRLLSDLREVREQLTAANGSLRRVSDSSLRNAVDQYNSMVSSSKTATDFNQGVGREARDRAARRDPIRRVSRPGLMSKAEETRMSFGCCVG